MKVKDLILILLFTAILIVVFAFARGDLTLFENSQTKESLVFVSVKEIKSDKNENQVISQNNETNKSQKKKVNSSPSKNENSQKNENSSIKSLGSFTLTAYCGCKKCCGKTDKITATGTKAKEGRTIAVDPKKISLGSTVIINGHSYVAEDRGGATKSNKIDIYFESHQDAINFGKQKAEVFLVK